MGWMHYAPFIAMMIPFLLDYKKFLIPRKAWIWFAAGLVVQYAGLSLAPWAVMILEGSGFGFAVNPAALPQPHFLTFMFDIGQHLMKTLFTIAGSCTILRKIEDNSI